MKQKTLQWIETFLFLVLNLSIFYAGADHPVPKGFIWLVLWIVLISLLQHIYLGWFLKEVRKKDFLCLHLFVYIGMGIISLFYLIHGRIYREYLLFVFFVLGIFVLYGFVFYVINRWLACKFL